MDLHHHRNFNCKLYTIYKTTKNLFNESQTNQLKNWLGPINLHQPICFYSK